MGEHDTANIPDYTSLTLKEQEEHRAQFRVKFSIIRNSFPEWNVPDISDNEPLEDIYVKYLMYLRKLNIDHRVDQYKVYLVGMLTSIELVGTKVGLRVHGYTKQQIESMNKYLPFLMELAEADYEHTRACDRTSSCGYNYFVSLNIVSRWNSLVIWCRIIYLSLKQLCDYLDNRIVYGNCSNESNTKYTPQPRFVPVYDE